MRKTTDTDCGTIDLADSTVIHFKWESVYLTKFAVVDVIDAVMACTLQISGPDSSVITASGNTRKFDAFVISDNGNNTMMTAHKHKKPHLHRNLIPISGK